MCDIQKCLTLYADGVLDLGPSLCAVLWTLDDFARYSVLKSNGLSPPSWILGLGIQTDLFEDTNHI